MAQVAAVQAADVEADQLEPVVFALGKRSEVSLRRLEIGAAQGLRLLPRVDAAKLQVDEPPAAAAALDFVFV